MVVREIEYCFAGPGLRVRNKAGGGRGRGGDGVERYRGRGAGRLDAWNYRMVPGGEERIWVLCTVHRVCESKGRRRAGGSKTSGTGTRTGIAILCSVRDAVVVVVHCREKKNPAEGGIQVCQSDAVLEWSIWGSKSGYFCFAGMSMCGMMGGPTRGECSGCWLGGVGVQNIWNKYTVVIACVEHERE